MKAVITVIRILLGIFIIHIALFCTGAALILTAPDIGGYFDYRDKAAFEEITGTVTDVRKYDDHICLTIERPRQDDFFADFVLRDGAFEIAMANGLSVAALEGAEVTLRAQPSYLGDGWIYPIAALTIDDTEYLSFDDGYEAVLSEQFRSMIGAIFWPSFWFFGGMALGLLVMGVRFRRRKQPKAEAQASPSDASSNGDAYTL